jgi:hypothetical protein
LKPSIRRQNFAGSTAGKIFKISPEFSLYYNVNPASQVLLLINMNFPLNTDYASFEQKIAGQKFAENLRQPEEENSPKFFVTPKSLIKTLAKHSA